MEILKNLYVGPKAQEKQEQILRKVAAGSFVPGLYIITFASNDIDQLNIVSSGYLRRQKVRDSLPCIVGFAIGRDEAYETVAQIAHDSYMKTGQCDLRKYLLSMQEE